MENALLIPFASLSKIPAMRLSAALIACIGMSSCEKKEDSVQALKSPDSVQMLKEIQRKSDKEVQILRERISTLERENDNLHTELDFSQKVRQSLAKDLVAANRAKDSEPATLPRSSGSQSNYEPSPVPVLTPPPEAQIQWWQPPYRTLAEKQIKASALAEWKDDYSQAEYEFNKQIEAFNKLVEMNKSYSKPVKDIIAKAHEKWPNDYSMMLYESEKQVKALGNLQPK